MRLKRASKTAIVFVIICLIIQLVEGAFGLYATFKSVEQGATPVYLLSGIMRIIAGLVLTVALLIVFGSLSSTREQLLCTLPEDSPDDDLTHQPHNDSRIRLRQTAGVAVVFVAISFAIIVLTHLVYIGRMLPFLGQGLLNFYGIATVLSLIESVLIGIAVLIVFKSLARNREQLLRDEPSKPPLVDAIANGGCRKIRCAAIVAMLLVLVSLIMGVAMTLLQLWGMMEQAQGHIDVLYLLTMIMGVIGGVMLDLSLLMVFASLLRIKEPLLIANRTCDAYAYVFFM